MSSDEAITEAAKAMREAAKFGGNALDTVRGAGGWLNRIFGDGIEDAVALHWSDRVKAKRIEAAIYDWERLTTLVQKVSTRLEAEGIDKRRLVPPKIALALIEHATVEYDEDIHSLWANLLATGLDAKAEEIHKKYISILSDLTSVDANLLKALYTAWKSQDKFYRRGLFYGDFKNDGQPFKEISIITLNMLGLVSPQSLEFDNYEPSAKGYPAERTTVRTTGNIDAVEITPLGEAFCKAVILS